MPTLRDVAELAGVSVATASNAINHARPVSPTTRARVERAASELGYVKGHTVEVSARKNLIPGDGAAASRSPAGIPRGDAVDGVLVTTSHPLKGSGDHGSSVGAARALLRLLRAAQPISRADLARRLGLNRSTVTDIFKPLVAAGVVLEDSIQQGPGAGRNLGRPAAGLRFNSDRDLFVGVSIGVRRTQIGVADLGGEVLGEEEFDTPPAPTEALRLVRASVEKLSLGEHGGRRLRAIGVSLPGFTDADRGRLLYAPHLGWHDVPVSDALSFDGVRVVVENDATAAALYEARLRLRGDDRRQLNNFVLVRSGTGIGVGLVLGGEVYRGVGKGQGIAGEFGHMTIVAGGKPCACGNRGCWERYAAASAAGPLYTGERVRLGSEKPPRYVEIVGRAEAGDLRARRTLERLGEYLGIGIGNVIVGLGVPRVIVSGRIVEGWKFISGPLNEAVSQGMAGKLEGWSVEPGEPKGAGLGGAMEVAVDGFLTSTFAP
ncbi:MAG TPA: ROK family protein [Pyrinomonadaceae bacterium]